MIVTDQSVSKEAFDIYECRECTLRFTQDVPGADSMSRYYQSPEYISHTDSSKGLINGLYQRVRKHTLRKKRRLIETLASTKAGNLLDIGSGTGAFVHEMKQHGWQVTGLEPDKGARSLGKSLYGLELLDMDQFDTLKAGSYDIITLWHVLEHVHDLHSYLFKLKNLLRDGGKLLVAVPNYTSSDAEVYKQNWAAYDVPRHLYHFSPRSMEVLLQKNGLRIIEHKPMWFDSFYISMLSSRYMNGKTNFIGALVNGLRSNIKATRDVTRCSSIIYIVIKE